MVGIAEGHPAGDELEGAVGREDAGFVKGGAAGVGIDAELVGHQFHDAQGGAGDAEAFHVEFLGVLEVAVVAAGHGLEDDVGCGGVALDEAGFCADELEDVGVVLLRHNGGAGAEFARKGEVTELRHGEEDEVFGQA